MSDRDAYHALRERYPELFENPAGAGFELLTAPDDVEQCEAADAARLRAAGLPEAWSTVGLVYEDVYLRLLRDAVRFPGGHLGTYLRIVPSTHPRPSGVVVVPLVDGRVAMVRHFRHATRTWHLEVPRGFAGRGEEPEDNARREVSEEIQADVVELVLLGRLHSDPGMTTSQVDCFAAVCRSVGAPQAAEGITDLLLVTPEEVDALVAAGKVTDALTLAALFIARLKGLL